VVDERWRGADDAAGRVAAGGARTRKRGGRRWSMLELSSSVHVCVRACGCMCCTVAWYVRVACACVFYENKRCVQL
jgi:hypothetical protein